MKLMAYVLMAILLGVGTSDAQKVSTGTFTAPHFKRPFVPLKRPQPPTQPSTAVSQQRRQLIMQQRQDRIAFEQQYRAAMQSLEASIKGQTPAQQAQARAQAQQQWRAKRKALLDSQRQARRALVKGN